MARETFTSKTLTFDFEDVFRLPDSRTLMPRRFEAKRHSGHPEEGLAELSIEVDSWGRPRCVGLTITPGASSAVTGTMLRRLTLGRLVDEAALEAATVLGVQEDLGGGITQIGPVTNRDEAAEVLDRAEPVRKPRQGSPITDEHLKKVAELYKKALRTKGPRKAPTEAVAMQMHASRSTAGRWVEKAREKGFLEPAQRGKAGG